MKLIALLGAIAMLVCFYGNMWCQYGFSGILIVAAVCGLITLISDYTCRKHSDKFHITSEVLPFLLSILLGGLYVLARLIKEMKEDGEEWL